MRDDDAHATYGHSWMLRAVEEWIAADRLKAGTCEELEIYLDTKLEKTGDVVGWWGVSIPFLSLNMMLIWCRFTQNSTQYSRIWPGTT